jgi:hypothetical protein
MAENKVVDKTISALRNASQKRQLLLAQIENEIIDNNIEVVNTRHYCILE